MIRSLGKRVFAQGLPFFDGLRQVIRHGNALPRHSGGFLFSKSSDALVAGLDLHGPY